VAHQAVPLELCQLDLSLRDLQGRGEGIRLRPGGEAADVYRLRVRQRNGQWAWLSPVWVIG
jgi:hypothetical protein